MQHSFWGWVPQGPFRTLYQSVWQNVLTWEVQGCGVGERLRRSEFETAVSFHKVLSGLSFHPLWNRDHPTHLACFIMFLDLPSHSPLRAFVCAVPSARSALLRSLHCLAVPHHTSASGKFFLDHNAKVAALYSWASIVLFSFIFLLFLLYS